MRLPVRFFDDMGNLFRRFSREQELADFAASFSGRPWHGLRANTLKAEPYQLAANLRRFWGLAAGDIQPVSWCETGFTYPAGLQPGKLPHHAAGLYYIQEPSAMLPAAVLGAEPGDHVLDLCAAPGGKACQIAAALSGRGLIWANDISEDRIKALLHNIEQTGCANCVITQAQPEVLADRLAGFFDKILVDAPCSGQGMFRRDPSAVAGWLAYDSGTCAAMQKKILSSAWQMLKPGGVLVYSTCTFALAENEEIVAWLSEQFSDCHIEPIAKVEGVSDGFPLTPEMFGTARIWPHLAHGEGHFCAKMRKAGTASKTAPAWFAANPSLPDADFHQAWAAFERFSRETLSISGQQAFVELRAAGQLSYIRGVLQIKPSSMPRTEHIRLVKAGLFLGQVRPTRGGKMTFEPSHSFLMSLQAGHFERTVDGAAKSEIVQRFLRGETLPCPEYMKSASGCYAAVLLADEAGEKGRAWPLGWAKVQEGAFLKNLYPKAWRINQ